MLVRSLGCWGGRFRGFAARHLYLLVFLETPCQIVGE